ncbi:MAG TPA: metallophosphoesterase family protein [Acidimicrobiales bacterium]|nr:metallophosphoesterase family protein [Acidimicrobiales bacterium]
MPVRGAALRVVVLADTHLHRDGPDPLDRLPAAVLAAVDRADVVLHAGDVTGAAALAALQDRAAAAGAELHAVLGNNDGALRGVLPEAVLLDLAGVRVGMVHDGGRRDGRPARLRRRFPTADVVVFGHSHVPCDDVGVDGQRLFNPGSPTERRLQPHRTVGLLDLAGGVVRRHRIVPV